MLEFATQDVFTNVKWSQNMAGKLAATTAEGDTSILSFSRVQPADDQDSQDDTVKSPTTYAPKWLFPKCGARFGFGGKLITFNGKCLK